MEKIQRFFAIKVDMLHAVMFMFAKNNKIVLLHTLLSFDDDETNAIVALLSLMEQAVSYK